MRFSNGAVTLNSEDIKVLNACGSGINELARDESRKQLPPGGILNFCLMLFDGLPAPQLWRMYRRIKALVRNVDKHYTTYCIHKVNGGKRRLSIPDSELRQFQRFILDTYLSRIEISPHACAFVRGKSTIDAAKVHVNASAVAHMDIKDFFPSVSEEQVFEALKRSTGYKDSFCRFLTRMCYHNGLPMGGITSPCLSNIVLSEFDNRISKYASLISIKYSRYCDDIYLSGDISKLPMMMDTVRRRLAARGFGINETKTHVMTDGQQKRVLCYSVAGGRAQLLRRYTRDLRKQLYYLYKHGRDCRWSEHSDSFCAYLQKMLGRVSFCLSVDPENKKLIADKLTVAGMLRAELDKVAPWDRRKYVEV